MALLTTNLPETLTEPEAARRAELEAVVQKHVISFRVAGNALAEIRESQLFRNTHATFADYCDDVWGITDRRARQLISAGRIADEAEKIGTTVPANEFQARKMIAEARSAPQVMFGEPNTDEPTARHDDNTRPEPDDDEAERKAEGRRLVENAPGKALAAAEAKAPGFVLANMNSVRKRISQPTASDAESVDAWEIVESAKHILKRIPESHPDRVQALCELSNWIGTQFIK